MTFAASFPSFVRIAPAKTLWLLLVCVACQSNTTASDPEKPVTAVTVVADSAGSRLVLYATEDCKPCQDFKVVWAQVLQEAAVSYPLLELELVNCDDPENEERCSMEAGSYGYPSVFLYQEGKERVYFEDPDTAPALMHFLGRNLGK